ncbi:aquaporin AQPcic [Cimex lectularius]|uniref:Aquaporin n=1 Tax=Cimex lectularius TaxID=79782 RepID=A0A8I6SIW0_CIMLE|nr:aquaporin AQPcic [Cimex lectularius]
MGVQTILGTEDVTSWHEIMRSLLAEFFGTFFLVFIGCGSCIAIGPVPSIVQIALCFGFVIATAVQCFGHVSGCHINPAVTLGLFTCGRCGLLKCVAYIPTQCAGAVAGAGLLMYVLPENQDTWGVTKVAELLTANQGFAIEAVITGLLILVVCAVTDPNRLDLSNAAPVAVGLTIAACHLFAVPYTGSSMNPARSLGPAAVQAFWENHWVYWIGPLVGGGVAGLLYRFLFKAQKDEENSYDL